MAVVNDDIKISIECVVEEIVLYSLNGNYVSSFVEKQEEVAAFDRKKTGIIQDMINQSER